MLWKVETELVQYPNACTFMEQRVASIIAGSEEECGWLLEHPPIYTAGTSSKTADLLTPDRFPVYASGRGGEYTYHGPGQRIAYLMLDLKKRHNGKPDLRKYVWQVEEVVIRTLAELGIDGERRKGRIGIWVAQADGTEAKIAAIGIRVRRWVTFHGLAINNSPNLSHFSGIVPCGIREHGVTSLDQQGITMSMDELDSKIQEQCNNVFFRGS